MTETSPLQRLVINLISRYGSRKMTLGLALATSLTSVGMLALLDVFLTFSYVGYLIAFLFPLSVTILTGGLFLGVFSHVIELRRNLAREMETRLAIEAKLRKMASRDDLTGVYNRRFFMARAREEIARAQRYKRPLSMLIIDVDHFKKLNDAHGHDVGDKALAALAGVFSQIIRGRDTLARVGGEEFVVLMPETGLSGAQRLAERLRDKVCRTPLACNGHEVRLSVSLGVSRLAPEGDGFEAMFRRADQALYEAKNRGRNQVIVDGPAPAGV